jgi:hypothetical protein
VQGYVFAKPLAPDGIAGFIERFGTDASALAPRKRRRSWGPLNRSAK